MAKRDMQCDNSEHEDTEARELSLSRHDQLTLICKEHLER